LKLNKCNLAPAPDLISATHPKTHILARTKRRRRFCLSPPFWRFNLQTFQALKAKSNPNQVIQNAIQVMEEEDCDFSRLFPLSLRLLPTQPANNPSPERQKQPKSSLSKMQLHVFFFYHTTKNSSHIHLQTSKASDKSSTILCSRFFNFNSYPNCINTQKANNSIKPIPKNNCAHPSSIYLFQF
jgi:hypothetical protein